MANKKKTLGRRLMLGAGIGAGAGALGYGLLTNKGIQNIKRAGYTMKELGLSSGKMIGRSALAGGVTGGIVGTAAGGVYHAARGSGSKKRRKRRK